VNIFMLMASVKSQIFGMRFHIRRV
jgi:hypothetical protein